MDWARSIQKEDERAQSVGQVYQMWRGKDAKAAETALAGSGLPADKVKEIMEMQATRSPDEPGAPPPPVPTRAR